LVLQACLHYIVNGDGNLKGDRDFFPTPASQTVDVG